VIPRPKGNLSAKEAGGKAASLTTETKPSPDGSLRGLFDWLRANVRYQRNHEQYEEDEKNDLRSQCNSHASETKGASYDSDKKKR